MRYFLITNILITKNNILINVPAFWHQFLQNISFISLVTKFASAIVKQKIDVIVKNPYFKLSANNITFTTIFKEFSLKKINNNIIADLFFCIL